MERLIEGNPMEETLIPYAPGPLPHDRKVLVLAPHPDDEIFGCGGAIALHLAAGAEVSVILMTAGDAAGDAQVRLAESAGAAQSLGLAPPQCWHIPDRHVRNSPELVRRILDALAETGATLLYAPSLWENHPDHRGLAEATLQAVRMHGQVAWMAYEVSAPLRPNLLLDIGPVLARKQAAMGCFPTQLALQRYDRHLNALNTFRTYTLPPTVEAAEGYEYYPAGSLGEGGLTLIEQELRRLGALISPPAPPANQRAAQEAVIHELQQALQECTRQRDELLQSTSWRVTRPLRNLKRYLVPR